MTRLLVVSPDTKWIEYLQLELEPLGLETIGLRTAEQALAAVREKSASHFGGVLVSTLAAPGQTQNEAALDATYLLTALRQDTESQIPIVLWSRFPAERLSRIVGHFKHTAMVSSDTAGAIKAALDGASALATTPPHYAKVELEIGAAGISVLVAIDGKGIVMQTARSWDGRKRLTELEEKFRKWQLWQKNGVATPRYTDYWLEGFKEAGEALADELDYSTEELRDAIKLCQEHVGGLESIHFRFNLLSAGPDAPHPYVHVPFELLYDTAKQNFVRALAPVARRICLSPTSRTATALAGAKSLLGPVLFVKSNAHGSHVLPGALFGGQPKLVLAPLLALNDEFEGVRAARAAARQTSRPPDLLELADGKDALTRLRDALLARSDGTPAPQILHYAGHSVQADDGTVYLVLPGPDSGQLLPVPISEFARWARRGELRLVLLSSCQSSTPDAVFRLAQAGIPAVVGFRWEVKDDEAAFFTQHLHQALADNVPLARAFHGAVSAVRAQYAGSPTFASPMLVVQHEEWTM